MWSTKNYREQENKGNPGFSIIYFSPAVAPALRSWQRQFWHLVTSELWAYLTYLHFVPGMHPEGWSVAPCYTDDLPHGFSPVWTTFCTAFSCTWHILIQVLLLAINQAMAHSPTKPSTKDLKYSREQLGHSVVVARLEQYGVIWVALHLVLEVISLRLSTLHKSLESQLPFLIQPSRFRDPPRESPQPNSMTNVQTGRCA